MSLMTEPDAELEAEPAEDPGDDGGKAERDEHPVRLRELVLLVVAVVGLVGTVFFYSRWHDLQEEADQRTEVEESAKDFLQALFTWDGTTIDEDFDRILAFATGDFEQEAQATFNDDQIREDLTTNRAGSRAEELDTFVRSLNGDDARVFAVVSTRVANAELPQPRADTVRIEIGMTREDGEWKVYDVNVLDGLSLGLPTDSASG